MEDFRIDFTLSDPFPDGKRLGECGEKNAAQLVITPPDNLASRKEIMSYVVAFSTSRGPVRYGPVLKTKTIYVPVGNALTVGSALSVQIEGYDSDGEFIIKSPVLSGIILSGSIAEGNCSCDNDKNFIPGHMHENLEVLENLSDSDGVLLYKDSEIIKPQKIQTVELKQSDASFTVILGMPFYGSMLFVAHNDKNGNPYVPDGAEIVSVEFCIGYDETPTWIDIRDMFHTEPHVPYFINQRYAVYNESSSGTIVSQVSFINNVVNTYYESAENYLFNGLRIKFIDKGGQE